MAKIKVLDCSACNSNQTMVATKLPRFSLPVRIIGAIIGIPSMLWLFRCIETITDIAGQGTTGTGAEEMAVGMLALFAAIPLVGSLIGFGLALPRKKVFKCTACGYIINRA